MSRDTIYLEVEAERLRQDAKFGEQNHDDGTWGLILGEEYGEACQAALDVRTRLADFDGVRMPVHAEALAHLREELVQVAAVAVAWVEAIDRRPS